MVSPEEKAAKSGGQSTGKIPTTAKHPNHVWSWDFVADRTDEGAPWRVLSLIDEFTREWISLTVARSLKADDVLAALKRAIAERGIPGHIRSDNGPVPRNEVTTKRSAHLSPGLPDNISVRMESKRSTSNREVLGRIPMWKVSIIVCVMSVSIRSGSFLWQKPVLSSKTVVTSTIESTLTAIWDSFPQI